MDVDVRLHAVLAAIQPSWLETVRANAVVCEARRPRTHNPVNGSVDEASALYLRAVVETIQPAVCVEVGTYIGNSALVLASTGARVYTCDKDNDVFPSTERITCFPRQTSTAMLAYLAKQRQRIAVDLFFFDGTLAEKDISLILSLATPRTVFAFDDYIRQEKGVRNIERIRRRLPGHVLMQPPAAVPLAEGRTTVATLWPEAA